MKDLLQKEKNKKEILDIIFDHYWWNTKGFSYRCNNSEEEIKEIIALALEPILNNDIRAPQSKTKINIIGKIKDFWNKGVMGTKQAVNNNGNV